MVDTPTRITVIEDSGRSFHFGVNFIVAPAPHLSAGDYLQFQQVLSEADSSLTFDQTVRRDPGIVLVRQSPPLEVTLGQVPGSPLMQLLITSPKPTETREAFESDCATIIEAYQAVWDVPKQVMHRDATIRRLFSVAEDHAFGYLWERRLRQNRSDLGALGRPVLGGGLRFVMPPTEPGQALIELKIESLLRNHRLLFLEVGFSWDVPAGPEAMNAEGPLTEVDAFLSNEVKQFLQSPGEPS